MSIVYEVTENVYRKPVEFRSAASYSLAAFSLSLLPVPEHAQLLAVPTLMTLAATRFFQGRRIRKYRKNLRTPCLRRNFLFLNRHCFSDADSNGQGNTPSVSKWPEWNKTRRS